MIRFFRLCLVFLLTGLMVQDIQLSAQETKDFEKLVPLFDAKKDFGPTGWMATQEEPGQTFSDYVHSNPTLPNAQRKYIDLVLLGEFDETERKIIDMTARYMEAYFQTPVRFREAISLSSIPDQARRVHPQTGDPQILSTFVIDQVLVPLVKNDTYCLIAFTPSDLWPGEGWNFVFGQASMDHRVGVWSIYRNGDPRKSPKDFALCLRRTIQTGTHEVGHMFGLAHCLYYECNMNGSNSRLESDQRPMGLCPVCLRKLSWGIRLDMVKRYQDLIAVSQTYGMTKERDFFTLCLKAIQGSSDK